MFRQSLGIALKVEFTQVFRKGVWQIKGNLYPLVNCRLINLSPLELVFIMLEWWKI